MSASLADTVLAVPPVRFKADQQREIADLRAELAVASRVLTEARYALDCLRAQGASGMPFADAARTHGLAMAEVRRIEAAISHAKADRAALAAGVAVLFVRAAERLLDRDTFLRVLADADRAWRAEHDGGSR